MGMVHKLRTRRASGDLPEGVLSLTEAAARIPRLATVHCCQVTSNQLLPRPEAARQRKTTTLTFHNALAAYNALPPEFFVRRDGGRLVRDSPSLAQLMDRLRDPAGEGEPAEAPVFSQLEDWYPGATLQIPVFSRSYVCGAGRPTRVASGGASQGSLRNGEEREGNRNEPIHRPRTVYRAKMIGHDY